MQGRDHRLLERLEERHAVIVVDAVPPHPVQTEFVLQVDRVHRRLVDRSGLGAVALFVTLLDPPPDVRAVGTCRVWLVDSGSDTTDRWVGRFYSRHEIGREGGDPAAPG